MRSVLTTREQRALIAARKKQRTKRITVGEHERIIPTEWLPGSYRQMVRWERVSRDVHLLAAQSDKSGVAIADRHHAVRLIRLLEDTFLSDK